MKTIDKIIDIHFDSCSGDMSKNEARRLAKGCIEFAQRWIPVEEFKDYSNNDNILVKFDDGSIRRFTEEFPFALATHCRLIDIP